jgi:hypothetical protein
VHLALHKRAEASATEHGRITQGARGRGMSCILLQNGAHASAAERGRFTQGSHGRGRKPHFAAAMVPLRCNVCSAVVLSDESDEL